MAHALDAHPTTLSDAPPQVRRIGAADLRAALRAGYDDFLTIPTQLVFLCLLYPVIGFVAARMATADLLPLLFPLIAGLSLMGPVMAVGLYELSRRREAGQPVSWLHAFDVLRSPAIVGIVVLGLLLLVLFGVWIAAARTIYLATIGPVAPDGLGALVDMLMHSAGGTKLLLLGNFVGLLFAIVVLATSVVSFPMMLDRHCNPAIAVATSIRVVLRNPLTMATWGVIVAVLLALGCIPFFVGLAVVMPILGHATWHLYRRAVA